MNKIPVALLCDDFRKIIRTDIDLSAVKHKSTMKKERKITDAMTQLLINTCDKFQQHKDYPLWNAVRLSRDFQKERFPKCYKSFQEMLRNNGFVIDHHYSVKDKKTKAVIIPFEKIGIAADYLENLNVEKSFLNDDVLIDWNEPIQIDGIQLPSKVRISTQSLKEISKSVKDISEELHQKWNLHLRLNSALENDGWLKQDYRVSEFGRIIGLELSSLQTTPKTVLKKMLKGCFVVDVNACAYALLPSIYTKVTGKPFRFPAIERYALNRSIVREGVSLSIQADLERIKQGFSAIAFGVRENVKPYLGVDDNWQVPTLTRIFGSKSQASAFVNHLLVQPVWKEMKIIFKALSSSTKDELIDLRPSQRVAYLYQHNEVLVLKQMIKFVGRRLIAPKHDAVIINKPLSKNNLLLLQNQIKEDLGFIVQLTQAVL